MANDRIPEKGRHPPEQVIVSDQEKRERARAALKVNESIAKERTTLVQQLDQLREENKLLKVQKYSKNCSDTHEERKNLSKKFLIEGAENKRIEDFRSILDAWCTPLDNHVPV